MNAKDMTFPMPIDSSPSVSFSARVGSFMPEVSLFKAVALTASGSLPLNMCVLNEGEGLFRVGDYFIKPNIAVTDRETVFGPEKDIATVWNVYYYEDDFSGLDDEGFAKFQHALGAAMSVAMNDYTSRIVMKEAGYE